MVEVTVPPELWAADVDGVLLAWLYMDGAEVTADDVIAEVTMEKSQIEIVAPASGVLRHKVEENAVIRCGDIIATIEITNE